MEQDTEAVFFHTMASMCCIMNHTDEGPKSFPVENKMLNRKTCLSPLGVLSLLALTPIRPGVELINDVQVCLSDTQWVKECMI